MTLAQTQAIADRLPVRDDCSSAYAYGCQLLIYCCRYPYSGPAELTIEDLDLTLAAGRHAETAREMAPAARLQLHELVLRLSRLLEAKRQERDRTIAQLASGEYPKGAPGSRPVAVQPTVPKLPPAGQAVPIIPKPAIADFTF